MKKTFLTIALMSALPFVGLAQTFGGGDGSKDSPFLLSTKAHLSELATAVNGGNTFKDQYLRLESNIAFTGDEMAGIGYTNTATPKRFNGSFDGNGKTISGLTLNETYYSGLFAYIDVNGEVKNLTLDKFKVTSTNSYGGVLAGYSAGNITNCKVTNMDFTVQNGSFKGGIVGQLKGAVLENCSSSGSITTSSSVGGLVGQNYGTVSKCNSSATIVCLSENSGSVHLGGLASISLTLTDTARIADSYFTGSIQGSMLNNCGGITATLNVGYIDRCWNGGYITGTGAAGGIVATLNGGLITNCYNTGTVYNNYSQAGGLVGVISSSNDKPTKLTNCYNSGTLFLPVSLRAPFCELVGKTDKDLSNYLVNCYYDRQSCGFSDNACGLSTKAMTAAAGLTGFGSDVWTFAAGLYPRLKSTATTDAALLHAAPFTLADGEDHRHVKSNFTVSTANDVEWEVRGGTASISGNTVKVTPGTTVQDLVLTSYLGDYERRSLVRVYPQIFTGAGTEASPYIIANKDDMMKLANAINTQELDFTREYFKITGDIDMTGAAFEPFGFNTSNAFNGILDGGNFRIKNLALNSLANKVLNVGLFVTIAPEGVVKNLIIDKSCRFEIYRNFAAFAAYLYGTLENCRNYAEIASSEGFSAGLVVFIQEGGVIRNCLNAGNVSALAKNGYIGGVFYSNSKGLVENCQNTGAITATEFDKAVNLGGVGAVNYGTMRNVINTGIIKGGPNSQNIGGIVTYDQTTSKLENALSLAPVIAGSTTSVGGVQGKTSGTYTNVYSDVQITVYPDINEAIANSLTTELTAATFKPFGTEEWVYTEGRYPMLKAFAELPEAQLGSMPLVLEDGMRRNQISGEGALCQAEGLAWSLRDGKAFSIANGKLTLNTPEKYTADVLTAKYKDCNKDIPVGALASLFPGKGTAASPWVLTTADDLVKLSADIADSQVDYSGKYFALGADIDMKDVANFAPISGTSKFEATFDGKNHSINNLKISDTAKPAGLFHTIGTQGVVKNLTIGTGSSVAGKGNTGAFVAFLEGTLDNCLNKASVTSTATNIGGMVGSAASSAYLANLTNEADINSTQTKTGGIIGVTSADGVKAKNLVNKGNITSTANYTGGILGYGLGIEISDSENYGDIKAKTEVGGIVGQCANPLYVYNCRNFGNISGTTEIGGIVGYTTKTATEIKECMNAGTVTAETQNAAGIIARSVAITIDKCANFGDITCTKTSLSTTSVGAAAILGKGDPTMTNCYNFGTIKAWDNLGAAIGYYGSTTVTPTITNFYNVGAIIATNTSAPKGYGMFVGKPYTSKMPVLTNCVYDKQVLHTSTFDLGATTSEILAKNFGEAFTDGTNGYPMLKCLEKQPVARLYRTALLLSGTDHHGLVTDDFKVAADPEVKFVSDDIFTVNGTDVKVAASTKGNYEFGFSLGDLKRSFALTLETGQSGIDNLAGDGKEIKAVKHYDLTGREVTAPVRGQLIITRTTFTDGTTSTTKAIAK